MPGVVHDVLCDSCTSFFTVGKCWAGRNAMVNTVARLLAVMCLRRKGRKGRGVARWLRNAHGPCHTTAGGGHRAATTANNTRCTRLPT